MPIPEAIRPRDTHTPSAYLRRSEVSWQGGTLLVSERNRNVLRLVEVEMSAGQTFPFPLKPDAVLQAQGRRHVHQLSPVGRPAARLDGEQPRPAGAGQTTLRPWELLLAFLLAVPVALWLAWLLGWL
jgi:hypothetical protein